MNGIESQKPFDYTQKCISLFLEITHIPKKKKKTKNHNNDMFLLEIWKCIFFLLHQLDSDFNRADARTEALRGASFSGSP